jgi:predicted transcriptional regulator
LSSQTRLAARRSTFEVKMDILRVAAEGCIKPTHIMYRSNTSWVVLRKNIESLVACGFMQQSGECSRLEYAITERGRAVLREFVSLTELMTTAAAGVRDRHAFHGARPET